MTTNNPTADANM